MTPVGVGRVHESAEPDPSVRRYVRYRPAETMQTVTTARRFETMRSIMPLLTRSAGVAWSCGEQKKRELAGHCCDVGASGVDGRLENQPVGGARRISGRRRPITRNPANPSSGLIERHACRGSRPRPKVVSEGGLEPPRPCGHQPLKLARLPIPPLRRGCRVRPARPPTLARRIGIHGARGARARRGRRVPHRSASASGLDPSAIATSRRSGTNHMMATATKSATAIQ